MKYTNAIRRVHGIAAAIALSLGAAAAPLHAAHPGDPDPSFGQNGYLWTDFFNSTEEIYALAPMADGRFLAAGMVVGANALPPGTSENLAVARYLPNGALDDSFGNGGLMQLDIQSGPDSAQAVKLMPNRGILVGAKLTTGAYADFGLVKLRHDGSLDTTFGELDAGSARKGYARLDIGGPSVHDDLEALAVTSEGRIVAAGVTRVAHGNFSYPQAVVARFTAVGEVDTSFGGGAGYVVLPQFVAEAGDAVTGIALDQAGNLGSDNRIVIVGYTSGRNTAFVARFNANGTLDTTFGTGGSVVLQAATSGGQPTGVSRIMAARLAKDGKILILGDGSDRGMTVMRLNTNGAIDASFGTNGRTTIKYSGSSEYDEPASLALQGNGKIVAAGYATSRLTGTPHQDFFVARLLPNGQPDNGFGDGQARAIVQVSAVDDGAFAVEVEPSGNLLVGGYQARAGITGQDFALLRLFGDPDRIFANGFDGQGFD